MEDPNPKVSGMGIKELEQRGIKVHVGILQKECEWLNRGYIKLITTNKPWVIAKVAQSEDKFLGLNSNSTTAITGKEARTHSHELRSSVDAVMIGTWPYTHKDMVIDSLNNGYSPSKFLFKIEYESFPKATNVGEQAPISCISCRNIWTFSFSNSLFTLRYCMIFPDSL